MRNTHVATRVNSTENLYPPTSPVNLRDFLLSISIGHEKNDDGGLTLRRPLTTTERDALKARTSELLPWVQPSGQTEIKDAIVRTFTGFASTPMSPHEAAVTATQYTMVMKGLPAWAVERACMRFASGDVRPQEVGAKTLDVSYRPSTAQLRMIAEEFVKPLQDEAHRIVLTLKGTAAKVLNEAERARGEKAAEEWLKTSGAAAAERHEERRKAAADENARREEESRQRLVIAEYRRAGVDLPEAKHGLIPSLALMLSMGCEIVQERDGTKKLAIPPNPFANYVPETPKTKPVQDTMAIGLKQAAHAAVEIADKTRRERRSAR